MFSQQIMDIIYPLPTKHLLSQIGKRLFFSAFLLNLPFIDNVQSRELQPLTNPIQNKEIRGSLLNDVVTLIHNRLTADDLLRLTCVCHATENVSFFPKNNEEMTEKKEPYFLYSEGDSFSQEIHFHGEPIYYDTFSYSQTHSFSLESSYNTFEESDSLTPDFFSPSAERRRVTFSSHQNKILSEIDEENKIRNYVDWHDIPNCTSIRRFWINDHFIELLGLIINIKLGRGSKRDKNRCNIIFKRFKESALPPTSILMKYVSYLMLDPFRFFRGLFQFEMP